MRHSHYCQQQRPMRNRASRLCSKIAHGLESHPSLVGRASSESTRCMGWPLGRMAINARDVDLPPYVHWAIAIGEQPETWGGVDLCRPVCNLRYPAKHFSNSSHTSSWQSPIPMARSHLLACCCSIPIPLRLQS